MEELDIEKGSSGKLEFTFPEAEKINIDKNSLQLQLNKFKEAIVSSFSLDSFVNFIITLLAIWVPMFTSDFKSVFGFDSSFVKGCYSAFALLVTIYSFYQFTIRPFLFNCQLTEKLPFFKRNSKVHADSNPEKMAQIILDKCIRER